MIAEHMANEVDFFSIGTNDLIQYTMAVDRGNELLSKLYQSFHPSILSLIKSAVSAAHGRRLKVSVCGEMAADPMGAVLLAGLGVDELSVSFQSVGIIKKVIKSISYTGARQIAENALKMRSQPEIEGYVKSELELHFPGLKPVFQFTGRNSDG
jgi:phosphotransferase system enzyme I (PtsI)